MKPEPDKTPFLDFALLVAEKARLLVAVPLVAALAALAVSFLIAPSFTATSRLYLDVPLGTPNASPAEQYLVLSKSRRVFDEIVARFDLIASYEADGLDAARRELEKRTKVSRSQNIISIEVEDHSPERAAEMANAFGQEFMTLAQALAVSVPSQRRVYFETQLGQVKGKLARSEAALQASGASKEVLKRLSASGIDAVAELTAQLAFQEIRLGSLANQMNSMQASSALEFRLASQELTALRSDLTRMERTSLSKTLADAGAHGPLYMDFIALQALHRLLAEQHQLARLEEERVIQFVEKAIPPDHKSKPQRLLIAVEAGLVVLVLVLLGILLGSHLRKTANEGKVRRLRDLLRLGGRPAER